MRIKHILAGALVCGASMGVGQPAEAITPNQLALDCFNAAAMFGIRPGVTFGFAPQYVRDWWSQNSCGETATDAQTCARISSEYGTSANVTWGYAPSEVQEWWTAHGCNTTSSKTPCQAAADRFGIQANVSWGLAPQYVKDYWSANSCSASFSGFNVTQCSIASFYYRIHAWDTFGWAPDQVTSRSIDVQQWWNDNSCTTSP